MSFAHNLNRYAFLILFLILQFFYLREENSNNRFVSEIGQLFHLLIDACINKSSAEEQHSLAQLIDSIFTIDVEKINSTYELIIYLRNFILIEHPNFKLFGSPFEVS